MVGVQALARIRFKHRRPRFLDLQEERIIIRGHKQPDYALRADAAHPNHLDRKIEKMEPVEQHADVLGQGLAV